LLSRKRAGQHFGSAGGSGIDQHHHRRALEPVARGRVEAAVADQRAALGADDAALVQQLVGDLHRTDQQPAGIAAHVEDQATQRRILLQAIHRLVEIAGGGGLETADAHIAEARLQHPRTHAGGADGLAHQGDVERFGRAFADDAHDHLGSGLAAQRRGGIALARHQRLAVDGDDDVAAAQARRARPGPSSIGATMRTPPSGNCCNSSPTPS
jgi:hypothetical protein